MILTSKNIKYSNTLFFRIMVFGWILMKIISWKVWMPERAFPTVPFLNWTHFPEVTVFLFGISLSLLLYFLVSNPLNPLIFLFIVVEFAQLLLDQNRWQPWEFQFLLTTIFYLSYKNANDFKRLLILLLGTTYVFSGLHKFNEGFLESNWGNLILKNIFGVHQYWKTNDYLFYSGYIIPTIETLLGLALLIFKNKSVAISGLVFMHFFIFLILSPFGVNYNVVVWPWNILMALFLILISTDTFTYDLGMLFFRKIYTRIVLVFIFVLPLSNLFGFWEHYLSYGLYSGKNSNICLCFTESEETQPIKQFVSSSDKYNFCPNQSAIFINKWTLSELKVPIYPEPRIYKFLEKSFQQKYPNSGLKWIYYKPDYTLKLRKESP